MSSEYVPATGDKLKFECKLDCGKCCRSHIVPVTLGKALEIVRETGLSLNSFFFKLKQDTGGAEHFYLSIRRKATPEGLACLFLRNNLCMLHAKDAGLKPENCKHVPYNFVTGNEVREWSDADKKTCRYFVKIGGVGRNVYFAALDSCPGVGQGEPMNEDKQNILKKAMAEDEIDMIATSEAIKTGALPVTISDREMAERGKAIMNGKGKYKKIKDAHGTFSYIVYPPSFASRVNDKLLLERLKLGIEKHDIDPSSVFRFSVLDGMDSMYGEESGLILGLYGDHKKSDILSKIKDKAAQHQYGFCDVGLSEYFCLL